MADESNTEIGEIAPQAEVVPPKKRRGPRPKNVVSEAIAETSEADAVRPARGRRKRTDKASDGRPLAKAEGAAKTSMKSSGKTRGAKQAIQSSAPAPVLEDIADLIQLEEENARLRKALADKLRAENADLRKRLGLA